MLPSATVFDENGLFQISTVCALKSRAIIHGGFSYGRTGSYLYIAGTFPVTQYLLILMVEKGVLAVGASAHA